MSIPAIIGTQPIYEPDQLPVLTRLLAEYTAKLNKQNIEMFNIRRERDKDTTRLSFCLVGGVAIESIIIAFLVTSTKSLDLVTPLSILSLLSGMWLTFSSVRLHKSFDDLSSITRLDLLATVAQLERLVRRISPIAEHSKLSLGEKLELDLRLGDAEAALEYAAQYTGKQSQPGGTVTHTDVLEANLR